MSNNVTPYITIQIDKTKQKQNKIELRTKPFTSELDTRFVLTVLAGPAFFFLAFLLPVSFCRKLQHTDANRMTEQ